MWLKIDTARKIPRENQVVLVQHMNDLYPAVAFWIEDYEGEIHWMREREGPEDGDHQLYDSLYHAPTHYMELPEPLFEI